MRIYMSDSAESAERVWYQCQRCTNCCRWPGVVKLGEGEAERLAEYLGVSLDELVNEYCDLLPNRKGLGLKSRPNDECIFLHDDNCLVQEVKPEQCRGFPNRWNFPGWRKVCEAVPVKLTEGAEPPPSVRGGGE